LPKDIEQSLSIDGKTVCGSKDVKTKAIHMVNAWANANQLVLGQVKTDEKFNEITAIPTLLDMLELKDCIVTIDAMGCQKNIAERIADYVLSLKGNQTSLHDGVRLYFEEAVKTPQFFEGLSNHATKEKGHGRIEKRYYLLSEDIGWLPQKSDWKNLNAIGMVRSVVEKDGQITEETRYFISSVTDVKNFARAVRSHWGVENSLHWCLDTVFHEDLNRTRKDNSAENFAVIRHIALNILKNYPAKMSLARKRRKCQYDAEFMADLLLSAFD
jgi:predicted transposase YbfD/YdcC